MFVVAAAAGSLLLGACGGDDVDACAVEGDFIHGCEGATSFTLEEEVMEARLERIRVAADGTAVMATHAMFYEGQDPPTRTFGVPFAGICVDYRDRMQFSPGPGDVQQLIADSRTYLDAGANVTLTSATGTVIEMARETNTADRSSGLVHDIVYLPENDPTLFEANTSWDFDAAFTEEELPGLDLIFAESAAQPDPNNIVVLDEAQVFTPPLWNPTFVTEEEYFAGLTIPETEPFVPTWENEEDFFSDDVTLLSFVGFLGEQGIDFLCVQPENGSMEVPVEVLAELPDNGTIILGTLTHVAAESRFLGNGRADFLAAECRLSQFTVERQ